MPTRILDIFRNAGDEHIGQTLVRLARAAERQHARAAAHEMHRQGPVPNGLDRDAQFSSDRAAGAVGAVRREVDS